MPCITRWGRTGLTTGVCVQARVTVIPSRFGLPETDRLESDCMFILQNTDYIYCDMFTFQSKLNSKMKEMEVKEREREERRKYIERDMSK